MGGELADRRADGEVRWGNKITAIPRDGSRAKHRRQYWVTGVDKCGAMGAIYKWMEASKSEDVSGEHADIESENARVKEGGPRNERRGTTTRHYAQLLFRCSFSTSASVSWGKFLACVNESAVSESPASGTTFIVFRSPSDTSDACIASLCF